MGTRFVRSIGKRFIRSYVTTLEDGTKLKLRTMGSDRSIAKEIFPDDVYEKSFAPQSGDVVVDVGANIGCFSLRAARKVGPEGKVFAFEPMADNFAMLKENIRLNGLLTDNIIPVEEALGDYEGEAELRVYEVDGSSSLLPRPNRRLRRTDRIRVSTLDAKRLQRLDFLKLDAEGFELSILKGASETLKRCHPQIAGEAHPQFSDSGKTIMRYLQNLGYEGEVAEQFGGLLEMFYARPTG